MKHGNFVWCDLSARNTRTAKAFYAALFGWTYLDEEDYHTAQCSGGNAAGIYTMPTKFENLGLPCFWMSYIWVSDVGRTVEMARKLGGRIELGPIPFYNEGDIALIRDPSGAGFTVCSGDNFPVRKASPSHGCMIWNELCVSKASAVTDFYEELFHWSISRKQRSGTRYQVFSSAGDEISAIEEVSNDTKGRDEFWGVYFGIDDTAAAKLLIAKNGGSVAFEDHSSLGPIVMATDPDDAAFFLIEG